MSFEAVASNLSFSARLVNADGSPVAGPVDLRFELAYSDDTSIIQCTKDVTGVGLSSGVFHTNLNFETADCGTKELSKVLQDTPATQSLMMRVSDRTDTDNIKTYPFQALNSVPMSVMSEVSKTLVQMGAADGEVLKWNGTQWAPASDDGEPGTVTEIQAGDGLTANGASGGSITGSGTMAVAPSGIDVGMLADNAVTSDKIDDETIQNVDIANGVISYGKLNIGDGEIPVAKVSGLGTAAFANIGMESGNVASIDSIPGCAADEKIQISALPLYPRVWDCVDDSTAEDNTKLPLDGSQPMGGTLDMGGNALIDLQTPLDDQDAATKKYVDDGLSAKADELELDNYVPKAGGTMTGALLLDAQNVLSLGDSDSSNYVSLRSHATVGADFTLTLPSSAGSADQVLTTDGNGALSWSTPSTSATPEGSAGGELAGSYPNPTINDNVIDDANVMTGANINAAKIGTGAVSNTEFNTLSGVTSSIQDQLDAKEGAITAGTTSQYLRGDKSLATLDTSAVPENGPQYFTTGRAQSAVVTETILDGVTATSPSENAVFDALALKADTDDLDNYVLKAGDTMSGALALPLDGLTVGPDQLVTNGGNVGIGTTTPTGALEVKGPNSETINILPNNDGGALNPSTEIRFWGDNAKTGTRYSAIRSVTTGGLDQNELSFIVNYGSTQKEAMRIRDNGNVGIGTVSPGAKLEVAGQVKITGGAPGAGKVLSSDASGLASWVDLPSSNAPSGAASGELSGNYPGPTIADGVIDDANVAGDAAIAISKLGDGTVSDIEFSYLDGVTSSIQTQLDAKEGTITGGTASQYWSGEKSWETLNTDAVAEASNLYFTDQRALDATVDDAIVDAEVDRAPSQNAVFDALTLKADASSLSSYVLKGGDTMTGALNLPANGLNVGSTQLVVNGGNVGVGTGSPSEKLTVSGNMTAWGKIEADYNGTEDAFHAHQEGTGNIASFSQGAGWDQKMVLTNNGNVGIGTTSPQRKLHTGNAGPNDILLENTADSSSLHLRTDGSGNAFVNNMNDFVSNGTTGNALLTVTGQDGIRFNYGNASSSGTETMRIDNTGNVGIGTATPSSKLEVTGDIKVTGRVIQSSSPASSLPVNLTGLAGYWNFQEGAAVDHSGNGNAGDLRDADIANADGDTPPYILESRSSSALWCDGVDDYLHIESSASLNITSSAFSFDGWIFWNGEGQDNAFLNKESQYEIRISPSGMLSAAISTADNSPGWAWVDSTWSVPIGRWVHVGITYDGTNIGYWGDGRKVDTQPNTTTGAMGTGSEALRFCARSGNSAASGFQSLSLDEVRIWNRLLSPAEFHRLAAGTPVGR